MDTPEGIHPFYYTLHEPKRTAKARITLATFSSTFISSRFIVSNERPEPAQAVSLHHRLQHVERELQLPSRFGPLCYPVVPDVGLQVGPRSIGQIGLEVG